MRKRPGEIHQLLLARRKAVAAFPTGLSKSFRQSLDEISKFTCSAALRNFFVCDSGVPSRMFSADRSGEQIRILQHNAELLPQFAKIEFGECRLRRFESSRAECHRIAAEYL